MKYNNKANNTPTISHTNDQLTYAFIDAQNLHQSSKHWGWKLDYTKFREYLRVEFNVTTAYLFMGYIQENQDIYSNLQKQGYILVFRETSEVEEHIKGNCDVELVMQAMLDYNEYEQAVVVTGDGDFTPLIRHLNNNGKLKNLLIPNRDSFSKWLTKTAKGKMTFINLLKSSLYAPMHSGDTEENNSNQRPRHRSNRDSEQQNHEPVQKVTQERQERPERIERQDRPNRQERTERPERQSHPRSRNNHNQPTVIKFYNTETLEQNEMPIINLAPTVPVQDIMPTVASLTTTSTPTPAEKIEVIEKIELPKKTTRTRTPRAKKVISDTDTESKTEIKTPKIKPNLSKPIKDVSIFL